MQKYKVFLNGKRILFTSFGKITFSKTIPANIEFKDSDEVKAWLNGFEKSSEEETVFVSANPADQLKIFKNSMINIEAAGGLVRKHDKLLFIFRNEKWDLPKGKIEKQETNEAAAIREVQEECGVETLRIVKKLAPTYHLYRSPYKKTFGQWIFKTTYWFEMEYEGTENGVPQTEEGITEVRWFKTSELGKVLANTYANLKPLIELYRD